MAVEYRSWLTEDIEDTPLAYVRSMMAVPMVVKGTVFGDITLTHEEPAHFTQDHVVLIQNVANHLAVAIENARLFEETDRKAKELEALYQADQKLFASLDLDDVLQSLADIAVDVLGADKSLVSIAVAEGGRMTPRAWRNISEATREFYRGWEPGSGKPGFLEGGVVASGRDDIPEDTRRLLQKEGIIATLDVPIIFEGHTRGAFGLGWTRPHESSESEKASAFALAQRAAVAIQNADLYARAQQAASLEERQRLARELHDSVSQALYGIALGARTARTQLDRDPAKAAEPMDYVLSLAEAGLAEMRALIFELRPESLATEGLVAALEKQVAAVRSRHGLSVSARLCREPEVALEVKEAIYRIAQEALHNVVKHAQATSVVVELADSEGRLMLTVSDDGRGFDAGGEYPGHMGLDSMRERAEKAGGIFTVDSAPGRGTRVSVQFSSRS
jgi:signal transduction histidine kinase